jgi:predicted double-glycine peptidase
MKLLTTILLAILIIGITPAFATAVSTTHQTADFSSVKGKGIDCGNATTISGQNESEKISKVNNGMLNKAFNRVDEVNEINTTVKNLTTSKPAETDTESLVMQSTSYNCGPAALATVLNNLGVNATEQELADLAKTDESGTTMYGLVQAVQAKGLKATGMKLSQDNLKKNDIVFLNISGSTHYSVVKEVTNESVKLADPSLGNIEIPKKQFEKVYSGYSLIISDTAGNLNVYNLEERNSTVLDNEQMLNITGKIVPLLIVGGICIMCASAYVYWAYSEGQKMEARSGRK